MPTGYKPISFPEDESAHDCIIEWWYFNGHLKDENGNGYAFMNCLFKVDVKRAKVPFLSKIPLKISHFSHSLVTNLHYKSFHHRIAPFSMVSDDSFSKPRLYVNYINPEIKNGYVNCAIEKVSDTTHHVKNEDIDLQLTSTKQPVLEGGNGFLDLHSKTTYYYSLTNLKTEGRIRIKNKWINVTGKSWMDHQWSDSEYAKDRWDWFSVQLDNGTEMVCCMYDDGEVKTYFADISNADNTQEHFRNLEIVPMAKHWKSPKSSAAYPMSWNIRIPARHIDIVLTARVKNQEMLFGSINYWEGPMLVSGSFEGKTVSGVGFMELVGYPSRYGNVKYIRDEIGKTAGRFVSMLRNKTSDLTGNLKSKIVG